MFDNQLVVVEKDQLPEGWIKDKSGQLTNKRSTLCVGDVTVLMHETYGSKWRFNHLTMLIELDGVPVPDKEIDLLWVTLSMRGWRVPKIAAIDGALAAAYANAFHPVQEYLDLIAVDENITPADLSKIATNYLDTKDELYDAMLRATLIGAVSRTYEPGSMFKTALTFKGGQDIGKSSVVRNLASPDWVCDTTQDNDKDFKMAVHSTWIYELAELDSITNKKQAGALKNLLSSPKDLIRPPYGRRMENHNRQSIFIGTSNRDDFLRDETGACRWWVVELPHNANKSFRINHDRVRQDRDAIWKAAVLAYRAGELPLLTDQQQAESNRRNLGFELDHPWEDYIIQWLEKPGAPDAFTTEQCFHFSGCGGEDPAAIARGMHAYDSSYLSPVLQRDAVEVGKILRRLGYEKDKHQKRVKGKKQKRMWRRVTDEVGHDIAPALEKEPKWAGLRCEDPDYWENPVLCASNVSTVSQPPEAGQTPTSGSEDSDPPHVSSSFIEREQEQEEDQIIATALLGKTPEASEALSVGSSFDVSSDEEDIAS